ncbi:hypothetical protein CTAYLR_003301 [Chrysophaeum taylorii]|uniref:Saccharopine dehydrogenase n=1 Tax=Chrysophaeum taylorii TaxID=2483200 RepID=A0AAD7UHW4_9STRA|nr:hypothetical protein CTAYLR_003301 [Chrysophaeum taylorii]
MPLLNIVGPDIDEYLQKTHELLKDDDNFKGKHVGMPKYYHEDPDRDPDSVRGCFLDALYADENFFQKLADFFFDGDVPYARENCHELNDAAMSEFLGQYEVDPGPRADRPYHVCFYGMSGYTASMVMEYLKRDVKDSVEIAFFGRSAAKVTALRDQILGGTKWETVECMEADLMNPNDVERLVSSCRCVVNLAGPFVLSGGERLVEACVHYDTDYCDVSGEIPWNVKLMEFHDVAWETGVYLVPSAAFAGGMPDLLSYVAVQKLQDERAEATGKCHVYVQMGGTATAPSGGTLMTRAAMMAARASSDEKTKKMMSDPFVLGGHIENGFRDEDQDEYLARVFHDKTINKWVSPHLYALYESRIVRRSNFLHHRLVGGPNKGKWYGLRFNFTAYVVQKNEIEARKANGGGGRGGGEGGDLRKNKFYAPGDGPLLDDLIESEAYTCMHCVVESDDSDKRIKLSIKGYDAYYETARMVVETSLTLALRSPELRTGKNHVRGGLLTPAIAGRKPLFERLLNSGLGFLDCETGKNLS